MTLQWFTTESDMVNGMVNTLSVELHGCGAGVVFDSLDVDTLEANYSLRFDAVPGGYWQSESLGPLAVRNSILRSISKIG